MSEIEVKALEWSASDSWDVAKTVVGTYVVRPCLATNFTGQFLMGRPGKETSESGLYPSEEAAKAAAQKDFETRIRSALVSPPAVPGEVHAQLALIKHLAEYTTEKNWADKRLYIMQAVDRALAAPSASIEGETHDIP